MINVGVNGFGRIGRVIFRACMQENDIEVSAINDPAIDIDYMCYLIKFDSTHGKFKGSVTYTDNEILVNEQKIISCASSTLYCLAPIIKILEENYGVLEGFITSIHAMTPSLKPLDGLCLRGKHWRDHRSIHQNIIPATTGACKALNKIIPHVKDKMSGIAFRVPIVNVSVLDITVRLNKSIRIEDIFERIDIESKNTMKNIIKVCTDEAVSSDFLGDQHSCIIDVKSSLQLTPNFFKLICWYENEYSYACRVIDSIKFLEKSFNIVLIPNVNSGRFSKGLRHQSSYCHQSIINSSEDIYFKPQLLNTQVVINTTLPLRNALSKQYSRKIYSTNSFKMCNDKTKVDVSLKNKNEIFQSYVALKPEISNITKNQERLQKVKHDVTKMINMTENLLKETGYCNKYERLNKNNAVVEENQIYSNIFKIAKEDTHLEKDKGYEIENICDSTKNISTFDESNELRQELSKQKVPTKDQSQDKLMDQSDFLLDDTSQIPRKNDAAQDQHISVDTKEKNTESYDCNNIKEYPENNVPIIDESKLKTQEQKIEVKNTEKAIDKNDITKKVLESTISKLSSEEIYCSNSIETDTSIKKDNIIDKLESVSNSDSDNSFYMNERKSQVINLTDLTSSAENLERLDKICRIIEISDDLSDSLFSALDKGYGLKRDRWSLKDLCKRLKLDDYVNKVFEHSPQDGA